MTMRGSVSRWRKGVKWRRSLNSDAPVKTDASWPDRARPFVQALLEGPKQISFLKCLGPLPYDCLAWLYEQGLAQHGDEGWYLTEKGEQFGKHQQEEAEAEAEKEERAEEKASA